MKIIRFAKTLSANDIGMTGSHQAGIHVPKSDAALISFFPKLDPGVLNPDAWISCRDENGERWHFRYVYYNNKLHRPGGTRNEYRITHMTTYFGRAGGRAGDLLTFAATREPAVYEISITKSAQKQEAEALKLPTVIKLAGWRRIY